MAPYGIVGPMLDTQGSENEYLGRSQSRLTWCVCTPAWKEGKLANGFPRGRRSSSPPERAAPGSSTWRMITRLRGRATSELSERFAQDLRGASASSFSRSVAEWIGLEHEYQVFQGPVRIDFRKLIDALALGQANLDPGDGNCYRLSSGDSLTCDEKEAEIATPPMRVSAGFSHRLETRAATARVRLASMLPENLRIEGYSTHLSLSVPQHLNAPVARIFTRTFAPALMLLLDRRYSPGLLVRPRPGRAELCGEFAQGYALRAAGAFAAGSIRACAAAVAGDHVGRASLPPELRLRIAPDTNRYGWYVDRSAFGPDLYSSGRTTVLRRAGGGTISAQEHLELCWQAARQAITDIAGPEDCTDADAMVCGTLPLPIEDVMSWRDERRIAEIGMTAFGSVLKVRHRPDFDLAPVMVTWSLTVFLIVNSDRTRRAFVSIPRPFLSGFLIRLLRGELDSVIAEYLRLPPTGRRLDKYEQTLLPALYDELGLRRGLLPAEQPPHRRPRLPLLRDLAFGRGLGAWRPIVRFGSLGLQRNPLGRAERG